MKIKLTGKKKLIVGTLIFVVIFVFVGYLMQNKMQLLLHDHMENQVATQTKKMSDLIKVKLDSELNKLEAIAGYIEQTKDISEIWKDVKTEENAKFGLMTLDGNAVWGKPLSFKKYKGITPKEHRQNLRSKH